MGAGLRPAGEAKLAQEEIPTLSSPTGTYLLVTSAGLVIVITINTSFWNKLVQLEQGFHRVFRKRKIHMMGM